MYSIQEIRSKMSDVRYETVTKAVTMLTAYILHKDNIGRTLNPIIKEMQLHQKEISSTFIFKHFTVQIKKLTDGTKMISNLGDTIRLSELVYRQGNFETVIISQARKNFMPFFVPEGQPEAFDQVQLEPVKEPELTMAQIKAQKMRDAKAKKRAEAEAIKKEQEKVNQITQEKKPESKLSDADMARLKMLRGLR